MPLLRYFLYQKSFLEIRMLLVISPFKIKVSVIVPL